MIAIFRIEDGKIAEVLGADEYGGPGQADSLTSPSGTGRLDDCCVISARAYTDHTDAVPPRFIRILGSSGHRGRRTAVVDLTRRSFASSRDAARMAHITHRCQRSL